MQNYSQVFAETLAEFESPYCPGDQGDAAKGQVTVRAGYRIHTTINPNVGFITKTPGQTQYPTPYVDGVVGVAVDALLDYADSTGADFLTDTLQPDGRRLIQCVYTAYAPPPPGSPPPTNWLKPTPDYLELGGPLVLKTTTPPPEPEPPPVTDDELDDRLDSIDNQLISMQAQLETLQTSVDGTQTFLTNLVEDVEHWLQQFAKVVWLRRRPEEP